MELAPSVPISLDACVKTAKGDVHTPVYPSTCSRTTAQFDQYSEYSEDDGSDFGEPIKPMRNAKPVKNKSAGKLAGQLYNEIADDVFQSADENTDFEPTVLKKRMPTGESSTDVPPSGAEQALEYCSDSDDDGFVSQKPKAMTPLVYPITLMLQMRALVAAIAPAPTSVLRMKDADELAQVAPVVKQSKPKRVIPARQGPPGVDDKFVKSLKSILIGLTADTVDLTVDKLAGAAVQTIPQLVVLIREIVERACASHQLAGACAELCVRIKSHRKFSVVAGADGEPNGFRQLLLDESWPRYQQLCNKSPQECEAIDKRHAIGNVKFMGELMARGLVSPRLLVDSAEGLLTAYLSNRDALEVLEALIALLMTACPRLDVKRGWVHAPRMDTVFIRLREMVRKQSAPLAVRLLLKDVISLRDNGWCVDTSVTVPADELRTCVGRSVDREPPKPKQMPRPVEPTVTGERSMLSLAREMLLAPVDAPRRSPTTGKHNSPLQKEKEQKEQLIKLKENKEVLVKAAPPGLTKIKPTTFNPVVFHREVSVTLRDLGCDANTAAAVQRIKAQNVPVAHQAKEYADLLTRVVEISRKAVRQTAFVFAAGLVNDAFDAHECHAGVKVFFEEVYADLCEDVPQLPTIIRAEFLPTLQSTFETNALEKLLPENL